ncbi:hypothetical protein YC2023_051340 [Brassica napus]
MIAPVSTSLAFPHIICLGQSKCKARNSASRLMALRKHQKQPENPIGILFYVPYLSTARLRVKTAEFGAEKLPRLFTALYGFWAFPKWYCWRLSSSRFKSYEVSKFRLVLGKKKKNKNKKGCNTRTSREVTRPSTTLAQAHLTAEF